MRVRMYSDTVLPRADGVAVALEALGRALLELDTRVEVVMPHQHYGGTLSARQTPALRPPMRDYHVGLVLPWARTNRISSKEYDVVHVHTLGPVGLSGLTAAHLAGLPAVLTWHTDLAAYRPYYPELRLGALIANLTLRRLGVNDYRGFSSRDLTRLLRRMWAAFDTVIAPSEKVRLMLQELDCPKPIVVLPSPTLPLPPPEYTPAELCRRLAINQDSPIVLSVGRLSGEKNLDLLVRSFALLRKRYPSSHLLLVGPSRGSHKLKRTAHRLKVESAVHIPGPVDREVLGAYYAAADVFVVPSLSETQCLAANEAEAYQLPVIVVDKGLTGTSNARTRILANPNAQDLSNAMFDCIRRSHRSRIIDIYPAPEKFLPAPQAQGMKLLDTYSSVIASKSSPNIASRSSPN